MLKKIICFCAALFSTLLTLSAVEPPEKTFTVGFDANFKPYGYFEDGEYKGFDLDLAREVARRNNWKLVLKPIDWNAKDSELNSGMIDCIWNGFTINGRENSYTWSDPYVMNEQVVLVTDASPVQKLSDLAALKVVVQTDTPVQKALSEGGKCWDLGKTFKSLIVVPDYNNAVMMLESGAADAVALDIGVAKEKLKSGKFRILDEIVMTENYGIGFRKGDTQLRDIVEKTLLKMVVDGTAGDISAKYFEGDRGKIALGKIRPEFAGNQDHSGKTFTVGFDANFKPYGYFEDGEYKGFDLDLAREVARRNNWKLVLKPIDWNAKDSELNSGMIDCIWNGFTINGRENSYTWSDPYVMNEQVVLVTDASPVQKLSDLAALKVVVQSDTPVQKALSEGGKCWDLGKTFKSLIVVPDYNNAVMMLESGAADAVALDIGVAKEKLKSGKFRILDEIIMTENYGIGFRKGDTQLRDIVEKTLLKMVVDGTAGDISAKYFEGDRDKIALGKIRPEFAGNSVGDKEENSVKYNWIFSLIKGLGVSVIIFLLTLFFALPLGLLVAWGRMSRNIIAGNFFRIFISVMRGTPLMLQLLVWGYGPYYLLGIDLSKLAIGPIDYYYIAVIIGFSFNYAAYFAEIYRAGIESIPRGQYEAAMVLGYSPAQSFFRVILPQVVKRILPPVTNEVITLVKDTSLAFSLSVLEMFTIAKQLSSAQASMVPLIVAGIFYYVFNFLVAGVMALIEKKMNYYR